MHKSHAANDSKAQEAALSLEVQVREELKQTFEKEQYTFKHEREALISQVGLSYWVSPYVSGSRLTTCNRCRKSQLKYFIYKI